jgi:23S rRNA (uracil1939-C5)-methyltransferase
MLKKGETTQLKVEDLAYQGKSIAKLDGLVIFLNKGIPGDVVRAKITKIKPNYLEAEIEEIVEKSYLRVGPVCQHFGVCGGCHLQDLKYEEQLRFKTKQVKETLKHVAGLENLPVEETLPSPDIFFYRNKMEFSFGKDDKDGLTLGLHQLGRFDKSFDLIKCFLQSEESNQIVGWVRDFVKEQGLIPYDIKAHEGFLRYLVIKEGKFTQQMMVNLVTYSGEFAVADKFTYGLRQKFHQIASIVRNINSRLANIALGQEQIVLYGKDGIYEKIGDFGFEVSSNSFFQTNSKQIERLYGLILKLADLEGKEEIWDLYSGTGAISIFLSPFAKKIIGVESSQQASLDAQKNAELNKIRNLQFVCAEVKQFLKDCVNRKDEVQLVILDPPRAGLHPKVIKYLMQLDISEIIYVSCNPATLSRDLKIFLANGYDLKRVCPVDMFPHTFHIECVAQIEKRR